MEKMSLNPGTLWKKTVEKTEQALKMGALWPINTKSMFINERGIAFIIRIVTNLARKEMQKRMNDTNSAGENKSPNPFLPYEPEMFVSDISDTHICLLNKYHVIEHHLLIVTREFEDQEMLLNRRDFEAITRCMSEFDALAFYNGGKTAGASQPHKHLQMIPLPMAEKGPKVPIETLLTEIGLEKQLGVIPRLRFLHCFGGIASNSNPAVSWTADEGYGLYRRMLQAVGLNLLHEPEKSRQAGPYNLLFTNEWMLLVPRSTEFFRTISINALGFAGALLVQNEQQLKTLQDHGCMAALNHTAVPV